MNLQKTQPPENHGRTPNLQKTSSSNLQKTANELQFRRQRWAKIRLFCLCTILSSVVIFSASMSLGYLANAHHVMYKMIWDQISFTVHGGGRRDRRSDDQRRTSKIGEAEMKICWSILIAIHHLGAVIGAWLFAVWDRQLGRLWTLAVVTLVFGIAGNAFKLLVAIPHCWPMFFIGRVLCGIAEGVATCGVPVFICEISPKSMRTMLGMMLPFGCAVNHIVIMVLGLREMLGGPTTWPYAYALNIASCTLVFPLALFLPRSPAYLLSRNMDEAARASLRFYHGSEAELDAARRDANIAASTRKGTPLKLLREKSLKKQIRLSIAIGVGYIIFDLMVPFSTLMFSDAGFSLPTASHLSIGIRVQSLLVFLITLPMADRVGNRRKFLVGTSLVAGTTVAMGVVNGLPTLFERSSFTVSSVSAPLFAVCVFLNQAAQDVGIRPLFYVLIPEMYPYQHRAAGKSFSFIVYRLISFAMSLAFVPILYVSNFWAYIGFSVPLWLGFGYCACHLRETSDQHLWEIYQALLSDADASNNDHADETRPLLKGERR